jgi:ubiquinone/menaquinone biosynthesis C-methylase UbiE
MPLPSEIYDREYFLSDMCEGYDRFKSDRGLSPTKQGLVDLLAVEPGMAVLDAGCGRGEVLLACARTGAEVAGIDYSEDAVAISRETLADVAGADVQVGDVTKLPWDTASFDRILFGDVIEHLDPDQVGAAMAEFLRVLKPGGMLLVHTAPNRWFLRIGWPISRLGMRLTGKREAAQQVDQWLEDISPYHVNEQSPGSLRRAYRGAGFERVRTWIDPDVLRGGEYHLTGELSRSRIGRAGAAVARTPPGRLLLGNDIFGMGWKPT